MTTNHPSPEHEVRGTDTPFQNVDVDVRALVAKFKV